MDLESWTLIKPFRTEGIPLEQKIKSVPIISVNKINKRLTFNKMTLKDILTSDERKQRKSVIIGVAGPYRAGKSFLLSYFVRYLHYRMQNRSEMWLKVKKEEPVQGFEYKQQCEKVTEGIWMWPEPFIIDDVAIYLMDTQGSFDAEQDTQDNTFVLALITMVSGLTIFNLQHNLQKNYVEFLHYCTQYGKMALKDKDKAEKRKLTFLIRDWENFRTYPYGFENTGEYVNSFVQDDGTQDETRRAIDRDLNSTFAGINCFLLPHPGENAFAMENFDGRISHVCPGFLDYLDETLSHVIDNIKVNTTFRTGDDLYTHFSDYFDTLTSNVMSPARSHFELTVDAHRLDAFQKATEEYKRVFKDKKGKDETDLSDSQLAQAHEEAKKAATKVFIEASKMGGNEGVEGYIVNLDNYINKDGEIAMGLIEDYRTKKKSRHVGIGTMIGGATVSAAAGAVFLGTAATALTCATGGIAGLAIVAIGASFLIWGKQEKMPNIVKAILVKTKATLKEIKIKNNIVTEEVPPTSSQDQMNQDQSSTNNSPGEEQDQSSTNKSQGEEQDQSSTNNSQGEEQDQSSTTNSQGEERDQSYTTAATALNYAIGGVAGLAIGASFLIWGKQKKIPKIVKPILVKTKATLKEIKIKNNIVTEEVPPTSSQDQMNQDQSSTNNSPGEEQDQSSTNNSQGEEQDQSSTSNGQGEEQDQSSTSNGQITEQDQSFTNDVINSNTHTGLHEANICDFNPYNNAIETDELEFGEIIQLLIYQIKQIRNNPNALFIIILVLLGFLLCLILPWQITFTLFAAFVLYMVFYSVFRLE